MLLPKAGTAGDLAQAQAPLQVAATTVMALVSAVMQASQVVAQVLAGEVGVAVTSLTMADGVRGQAQRRPHHRHSH